MNVESRLWFVRLRWGSYLARSSYANTSSMRRSLSSLDLNHIRAPFRIHTTFHNDQSSIRSTRTRYGPRNGPDVNAMRQTRPVSHRSKFTRPMCLSECLHERRRGRVPCGRRRARRVFSRSCSSSKMSFYADDVIARVIYLLNLYRKTRRIAAFEW